MILYCKVFARIPHEKKMFSLESESTKEFSVIWDCCWLPCPNIKRQCDTMAASRLRSWERVSFELWCNSQWNWARIVSLSTASLKWRWLWNEHLCSCPFQCRSPNTQKHLIAYDVTIPANHNNFESQFWKLSANFWKLSCLGWLQMDQDIDIMFGGCKSMNGGVEGCVTVNGVEMTSQTRRQDLWAVQRDLSMRHDLWLLTDISPLSISPLHPDIIQLISTPPSFA